MLSGASISLDTVGADPDLTTPSFRFMTDQLGAYAATYRNVSNPAYDFISLEITAPFSPNFYFNNPAGPKQGGATCNGGNAFNTCAITFLDASTTVIFRFSGLDATHIGFPYLREVGIVAAVFEPNQTLGGEATTGPVSTPEPGAFQLAAIGFGLCGLVVGRKKLLKIRVRS